MFGAQAQAAQIEAAYGMDQLREISADAIPDTDETAAFLEEALRLSQNLLDPLDKSLDEAGCGLEDGRVRLIEPHHEAWKLFREAGWIGLDVDPQFGGHGLPTVVATAIQEVFDRGSVPYGMVPGSARSAIRVLQDYADPALAAQWIEKLTAGEWAATIAISEPGAGSDVGRIRTAARRDGDDWLITGEKMWISFGDHDLVDRIGHLILARTGAVEEGVRGLSLFLVPNTHDDGSANGVFVRGIEHKLGLHGSPTCAMGFEDARGTLIGAEGRGLPQLFSMIISMRLQVGTQGLGLATACFDTASRYAEERLQGGPPVQPPVPIIRHADVRLALAGIASRVLSMRGLIYAAAIADDMTRAGSDEATADAFAELRAWLLPIVKNGGAELAFETAGESVLLLGGAGYTRDWPVERYLRNSRVLAVYEGTTGMQALDLVRRRWIPEDKGYERFLAVLKEEAELAGPDEARALSRAVELMEQTTGWLRNPDRKAIEIDTAARAALALATETAHGWAAARLIRLYDGPIVVQAARLALLRMEERIEAKAIAVAQSPAKDLSFIDAG